MIGVIGHMSGGKSYYAVEDMLSKILSSHVVVSNIRLNCQGVTAALQVPCIFWKQYYYYLTDDKSELELYHYLSISDYGSWPAGSPRGSADYNAKMVYVYLDEASSIFDSLSHSSEGHIQAVAVWARHTRKMGIELVLLMQFASELHKRLRIHIQEYVSCRATNDIRIPLFGCGVPWFLRDFSIRTRYLPDLETPIGSNTWAKFKPEIYRCYNTAQIVVGGTGNKTPALPRLDLSRRFIVLEQTKAVAFFILSCVLMGVFVWMMVLSGRYE